MPDACLNAVGLGSQATVFESAETRVGQKMDLIDRVAAGMMAKHAQVGSELAGKTAFPAAKTTCPGQCHSASGSRTQKFTSIEHPQLFSGSQDRPISGPLQGPKA
jgi:hypothetical protein